MSEIFRRTGTVMTTDGKPVSGAFITIKDASVRVPEIAIITDANGAFEIQLPAGVFTLRAYAGRGVGDTQFINPDPHNPMIDISLRSEG